MCIAWEGIYASRCSVPFVMVYSCIVQLVTVVLFGFMTINRIELKLKGIFINYHYFLKQQLWSHNMVHVSGLDRLFMKKVIYFFWRSSQLNSFGILANYVDLHSIERSFISFVLASHYTIKLMQWAYLYNLFLAAVSHDTGSIVTLGKHGLIQDSVCVGGGGEGGGREAQKG